MAEYVCMWLLQITMSAITFHFLWTWLLAEMFLFLIYFLEVYKLKNAEKSQRLR